MNDLIDMGGENALPQQYPSGAIDYCGKDSFVTVTAEARAILEEFGYLVAARTLEAGGSMSPTDANSIATQAIDEVSKYSERMAILAKAVNDSYLKQRSR